LQDSTYRITVMEPIGKLVGILPFINDAIKKRNKKLLDYDAARSKVKRLVEKPSDDPSKLTRVCYPVKVGGSGVQCVPQHI
jgi:hypothetical protein